MKNQSRVFRWKQNHIDLTELRDGIHWHLKMQSSIGLREEDHFLESVYRHIVAGGEDVMEYARERGHEDWLKEFMECMK
ncbi:hypothetical protein phiAS5_ORF0189 [Aeromonas phage phiAS5]|uniref:Uncharacterized protein n=1 Tax=Aeromonas phage phiAS5 TaxID=879630 RepID=E1A2T6_9CAUD|nr:hypothetical protein phiAS5_ORF0189 [Aeromonas phage phiAS5]ADM80032.1 hypothetical protein phiAS5_ORF0189 [Aeromonas phage phiAS5]